MSYMKFPPNPLLPTIGLARFVHLGFYFSGGITNETYAKLKRVIEALAVDWMKYGGTSWVLYTRETPESLYQRIVTQVREINKEGIFTFYVDLSSSNRSGQMPKWVWEWLDKPR